MKQLLVIPVLFIGLTLLAQEKKKITLEDIWSGGMFRAESVYGLRSMNNGIHYTTLEGDRNGQSINKYSYKTGDMVEKLVAASDLTLQDRPGSLRIDGYQLSADEKRVLIGTETERIFRYSTREMNYVFDIASKKLTPLEEGEKQRYATFSPSGSNVAFVRENNLYIKSVDGGELTQVTKDGMPNSIINGATDWVYEEEFAFDKAFFWSPNGTKLAYYRFDETMVNEFNMAKYGGLYPNDYRFKYPKAGEENAKVKIFIYDLVSKKTVEALVGTYEYIPRVKWSPNDDQLIVFTMNRLQNDLNLYGVNSSTGEGKVVYRETSKTYIEINDHMQFVDKSSFIWVSEKDGYYHLYKVTPNAGGELKMAAITRGSWDISDVYGLDKKRGIIYFQASMKSPLEREVYSVSVNGGTPKLLSKKDGTSRASFSKGFKYFVHYNSTATRPNYVSLHAASGKEIRVLKDNKQLSERLESFELGNVEFTTFKSADGQDLNASIIRPADYDNDRAYPVLMYVYGGPGSQTVRNSWGGSNYFWYQMLASKGYIVVSVDNRGTGARGYDFRTCTYRELGKLETEDQIAVARQLGEMENIDKDRIGIWGWSYGGYMSSLCLFKGEGLFKMAIAVAPVSNWKYYDTIYTERYMDTPQNNPGYEQNSPINYVDKKTGNYLLVHGTADDNVHFQNAVEMAAGLQRANKQFDLMIYPDRNHGIYGGNTRLHLFTLLTDYVTENL